MAKLLLTTCLLASLTGLTSCATSSAVRPAVAPPRPPPAPAAVMVEREPSFLQRMCSFLFDSPVKPTTPCGSLPPPKP